MEIVPAKNSAIAGVRWMLERLLISIDENYGSGLSGCHLHFHPSIMADERIPPDQREFPGPGQIEERARFLLEYAVLAPSSHNSQPWAFEVQEDDIRVYADVSRQLSIADPDQRELHLSVGCALENLRIAAAYFGLQPSVEYRTEGTNHSENGFSHVATVSLADSNETSTAESSLFEAIPNRHTNHGQFDSESIPDTLLDWMVNEARAEGLSLEIVSSRSQRLDIAALQEQADERQFEDPAYREELSYWIGSGALGANWLRAHIGQFVVRHLNLGKREGRKNANLIMSAPVVGVLGAESADSETWLKSGQVFERIALKATSEGIAIHPMSQILEVEEIREELATLLEFQDRRPVHLFRLGYAEPDGTRTPRRPVEEVLRQPTSKR